jgi:hypothetical protein
MNNLDGLSGPQTGSAAPPMICVDKPRVADSLRPICRHRFRQLGQGEGMEHCAGPKRG